MESKYIEDIFKDYLATQKTNYALLINGSWGSGKTYFWKTTLSELSTKAGFTPVYLSLNGISKIETLDYQLKIKLIPLLNKLDAKKVASVGNLSKNVLFELIKGRYKIDAKNIIKDVEIDLALFSNKIICFDDLERCKIPLAEVLGYVNDYVEHKNLKIIFLSDESKINGVTDENYKSIKEKVIGRTLNFKNNLFDTLPFLFEKYKTTDTDFFAFLESKKKYIHNLLIEYNEENLRNIAFFIDNLNRVYPIIKSHNDYSNEIIMFSLVITIEFKTGKLTSNDYQDFKDYEDLNSAFAFYNLLMPKKQNLLSTEEEKKEPKSEVELLHDKYLKNNIDDYSFYPSIYQFILTGYLDQDLLTSELKSRYPETLPIETLSYRKLLAYNFRGLQNDEFEKVAKDVFEYASEGKYSIYDYIQLSRFFNFFSENKVIEMTLTDIQEGLKKGIEIAKLKKESNKRTFDNTFHFTKGEDDEVIKAMIVEIHEAIEKEKELLKTNKLIETIEKNDIEEMALIFKEYSANKELFEQLDASKLFEKLLSSENNTINNFSLRIDERYNFSNLKDFLSEDYKLLKGVSDKIDDLLKGKTKYNLKEFLLNEVSTKFKEICVKLV